MNLTKHSPICAMLMLAAGLVCAQAPASKPESKATPQESTLAREGEWVSYRDAYRSMLSFEKYGKPKQFIQNHYQIVPRDNRLPTEPLRLSLNSHSIHLDLALDAIGRVVFPMLKAAYDENAEFTLNRKVSLYRFQPRVSIVVRADGVYEAADLRAACEQVLAYQRYADMSALRGKKCAGVRFAYPLRGSDPLVKFRKGEHELVALPSAEGGVFWDDPNEGFKTVSFAFSSWPEKGQVITQSAPIAIAAMFE